MKSVPVVTGGVVWIQIDRQAVLAFGNAPVKVEADTCETESAIRFGRTRIQLHCFRSGFLCGRGRLGKWLDTEDAEPVVVIGNAGIGQGILGIEFDSVVVTLERLVQSGFRVTVPVVAAPQV